MTKFILLDTETTGTQEEDRIIQLGYMVLDNTTIEVYNQFCSTTVPIAIAAMETHGITPEMIQHKPACQETQAFQKLLELNEPNNYLIIHNAPFDLGMLQKEGFENKMQLIDTLRVAKHVFAEEEAHRLQYFRYKLELYKKEQAEAEKLGIQIKAHDAIGDVLTLKLFLTELKKEIQKRYPDENSLQKMVELTQTPIFIPTFKFGKYRSQSIQEVAQKDRGYLEWMLNNMENLDEDLRYTLQKVLNETI